MTPESPARIGAYPIEREIGRGGMGVVYLARDPRLDRPVAIKVLPDEFATDPERLSRFEREAKLLASLHHPNIAGIYAFEEADGRRFLALEYIEGDTLAERLQRHALPVEEALEVCRQIAAALEAAHESGVIHRDLKPGNVKLTSSGEARVLDFGLAKGAVSTQGSSDLSHSPTLTYAGTQVGVILGTAAYMSPEQARGKPVDRRTDIWSFGCVLYECLTGRPTFGGETVSDTIAKILERDPDLNALPGATPERVRELLERCLAKDPKKRLRDIGEARILLDELLASRSSSGRLTPAAARSRDARRAGFPLRAVAIAAVVGVLIGAGLWSTLGPGAHRGPRPLTCVSLLMPPDVSITAARITDDGRTVVVFGRPKNVEGGERPPARAYVRPLEAPEFKTLPGTEGAFGGAPRRDSRTLDFVAPVSVGSPQLRLMSIPLDGSAPATMVRDFKDSWTSFSRMGNGDVLALDGPFDMVRLPVGGGPPSAPVKLDAGRAGVSRFELTPWTLPGDRGVAVNVVSYDSRGWHYSVGIADIRSGKVKVVAEDGGSAIYSPTGHLLFTRGDVILAVRFDLGRFEARGTPVAVWSGLYTPLALQPSGFTLTEDGSICYRPGQVGGQRALAFLDARGNLTPWSGERRLFRGPTVPSPDGRRFLCTITNARGLDEIWISDVDHPGLRRLGTDPNGDCNFPTWSPDGQTVAYRRVAEDDRDGIYVRSAAGGEPRRILRPRQTIDYFIASWLPDGSALLLDRFVAGKTHVLLLPLAGAEADTSRLRPLLSGATGTNNPRISPDGRWLAYQSDEIGKNEFYVAPFGAGGAVGTPVQVSSGGADLCAWSADGKSFYFDDDRRRLMRVSITATPALAVSPPVQVADLEKLRVAAWSLLRDGRFLVSLRGGDEGETTRLDLIQNWTEALPQKVH